MMQGQNQILKMNNKVNIAKTKKVVDPEDDDWKCKNCGCPAKHTPLKRTGRDGKKSICNACYIRERTLQERAERGSARPVLTTTVPMTTANILSNAQQNYFLPYWNFANLNIVQQMNMLTKMGQNFGVDNQQLYSHNFGLTQDAVTAALQAYQAAAAAAATATASGQLPVDYNSNLNMLGALGTLGLAAATTQTADADNVTSVLPNQDIEQSVQEIEQSVQEIQQSDLSQELKTDDETSKQDLESVQQQIQQITSASISDITNLAATVADVGTLEKLNKTNGNISISLFDQQVSAAVAAVEAQNMLKNEELIKEKINKEIKNLQEEQLRKSEEYQKLQKVGIEETSNVKLEDKIEDKKIYQKRRQMDDEDNLLEEKLKKELKRVKVDTKVNN